MAETLSLRGVLQGHGDWVTSIATTPENPNMILSGSRDKSVMVWRLTPGEAEYGVAERSLRGHNHFVSDVTISSDGQFALSGSWDGTMRLWEIASGRTTRRFVGHSKDVLSVAFSVDNRQIVSASRDKTVKLWNTLGECKYTITDGGHTDWVSCVRFSPNQESPVFISGGWDREVKVWDLQTCTMRTSLAGHTDYVNTVTVSPDGSLCASGGKDGTANLWDLNEGKRLYSLDAGDSIHSLVFSPNRYWLCAATSSAIKVWDLESKDTIAELRLEAPPSPRKKALAPYCTSLCWSADGTTLFAGCTDNNIHVYHVNN